MIAELLYSLLFIFGLVFTLISTIPPTKKLLSPRSQPLHDHKHAGGGGANLRSVFRTFDKNSDGYITKQELRESLTNIGISAGEKDVEDMVERVDSNGDGLIDFDEFCKLFDTISGGEEEGCGDLKEAFDVFDENKDGLITVEELGLVLSSLGFTEGKKIEDCKEMIRKVDIDGDGMVNFDEFKTMMRGGFGRMVAVS